MTMTFGRAALRLSPLVALLSGAEAGYGVAGAIQYVAY